MPRINEHGFGRGITDLGQVGAVSSSEQSQAGQPGAAAPNAPLGAYAGKTAAERIRRAAVVDFRAAANDGGGLGSIFSAVVRGEVVDIPADRLLQLQATALNTIQNLFTNAHGNDGELKHQVGLKQAHFNQFSPTEKIQSQALGSRDARTKQLDALNFVLRTFLGRDGSDEALRMAAMNKLAEVGRQRDIQAVMPHVRKGTASDLYHGFNCVYAITSRTGSPQKRIPGALTHDPVIGPLLKKDSLTDDERMQVIEAVLDRGELVRMDKLKGDDNTNWVYSVTFKETLPGEKGRREAIEGIFKPEKIWHGKDRAYFTREVGAYQFDKRFTKSGLIPPTVEAMVALPGEHGARVGSLQYKVPDAKPLGWPAGDYTWAYDPQFDKLRATPGFDRAMAKARTLFFILADPDKLGNQASLQPKKDQPNLGNFMIDRYWRMWLIDNALGLSGHDVDPGILPKEADPEIVDRLKTAKKEEVVDVLDEFVQDRDAQISGRRFDVAREELDRRLRGKG